MMTDSIPQLRKVGAVTQLYVGGKPFLAIGGELGNSTASDLSVLDTAMERLVRMHLNTVMLPVYWDRIEQEEGQYDFSLVRGAIELARLHGLRLVYLWFGTWKNGMSCYVPGWMKRDTDRFPRVRERAGATVEVISPTSDIARSADAKAFAELMRWTRQFDVAEQTVIMAQVENEIGLMPDARDHSETAQAAYRRAVPDALMSSLKGGRLGPEVSAIWERAGRKTEGNWSQVFGADAHGDEIFATWQFATYVEHVAAAGKRAYSLPMFTNAALIRPGYVPGQYPAAGPLPHLLEVWRVACPSLDMLCPDIYFPNFPEWCRRYVRNGNPLFIPEMAPSTRASANAVYAVAQCGAMGFGPFSIENVNEEKERLITDCFGMLADAAGLVLASQRDGKVIGLSPEIGFDWTIDPQPVRGQLGGITFTARFDPEPSAGDSTTTVLPTLGPGRWETPTGVPLGSAMICQLADDEFVILGMGVIVTFASTDDHGHGHVGIDRVQEGRYHSDGTWTGGRWLNGDETHQGRHVHLYRGKWTMQRVKLYRYE